MLQMAQQRCKVRCFAQKRNVKIQPDRAVRVRNGTELVVGQVSGIFTKCAAVGMAGEDWLSCDSHQIPKRRLGQVAHIDRDAEPLRFAHKIRAARGQSVVRAVRPGKRVSGVPSQGQSS